MSADKNKKTNSDTVSAMERFQQDFTNWDLTSHQFQGHVHRANGTRRSDVLDSCASRQPTSNPSMPSLETLEHNNGICLHQTTAGNNNSSSAYRFRNIGPHPLSLKRIKTKSSSTTLPPRTTPSSAEITVKAIILAYLEHYEKQPTSVEKFLSGLHPALCRELCNCQNHSDLLHHYMMCPRTNCVICPRVDALWRARSSPDSGSDRTTSGLFANQRDRVRDPDNGRCNVVVDEENQPAAKRTKVETASDDMSLDELVAMIESSGNKSEDELMSSLNIYGGYYNAAEEIDSLSLHAELLNFDEKNVFSRPGDSLDVTIDVDSISPIRETTNQVNRDQQKETMIADDMNIRAQCPKTETTGIDETENGIIELDGTSYPLQNLNVEEAENDQTEPNVMSEDLDGEEDNEIELMPEEGNEYIEASDDSDEASHFRTRSDYREYSGVALTDSFTAENIRQHLCSLNPSLHGNTTRPGVSNNTCQLCLKGEIAFAGRPMNCDFCMKPILQPTYHWTRDEAENKKYVYCEKCSKKMKKSRPQEAENIGADEPWVHCERCKKWQHQICALYNPQLDKKSAVKYTCPFCRLEDLETNAPRGFTRKSFEAEDLLITKLSDHIEQRLRRSLERERKERAGELGKSPEEVPGAEDLTVRVVVSVDKVLKVKQKYFTFLPEETYPDEFPYKLKVILLFQKIDGAEVLIFAAYVQEFGSKCGNPNQRSAYLSYLDSVKYFRPETETVAGVPLRTFVYHEILIGYLDYCKRRGFLTWYVWSCPPLKGDDFILYCHPQTQKTPKKHRLVDWYKMMIKKAMDENIVQGYTNFYKRFFVRTEESTSDKITAARLPYFEGSYWDIAIESILPEIEKGAALRKVSKRDMQNTGHSHLSEKTTKDILLMQQLSAKLLSDNEDLLVIDLGSKRCRLNKEKY